MEIDGALLERKQEVHCTLVAARKAAQGGPLLEKRIMAAARAHLQTTTVTFEGFTGEVRVCRKPDDEGRERITVVAGVAIAGLTALWQAVRQICPDFKDPALHVTLYKLPWDPYGISVNSAQEFDRYEHRDDLLSGLAAAVLPRSQPAEYTEGQ